MGTVALSYTVRIKDFSVGKSWESVQFEIGPLGVLGYWPLADWARVYLTKAHDIQLAPPSDLNLKGTIVIDRLEKGKGVCREDVSAGLCRRWKTDRRPYLRHDCDFPCRAGLAGWSGADTARLEESEERDDEDKRKSAG